jgi:beta-phosphoglucomutase-like phosphatase (HAD superfamily)
MFSNIKGIVYDFDGIIDTVRLNEDAWVYAAQKLNIKLTPEFIIYQRGVGNYDAAEFLLEDKFDELGDEFVKLKKEYFYEKVYDVEIFPDFLETKELLKQKGYQVWICTSTSNKFMLEYFEKSNDLKEFKEKLVGRNDSHLGKSNAEPLLKTFSLMSLQANECVYVGDAYTDYLASQNAQTNFVYYQQGECIKELKDYQYKISKHNDILHYLHN